MLEIIAKYFEKWIEFLWVMLNLVIFIAQYK